MSEQNLLSEHTDCHTHWTDCSTWTTKEVGNNIRTGNHAEDET